MKKLNTLIAAVALLFATSAFSQTFPPVPLIYGSSPFQDSAWAFNGNTFVTERALSPTLAGQTITGMTGLAFDPCSYQTYIILKVSGVTGRVLATIDLNTGVCTQIGNLGANFSSLTFDNNGQLFGATGNGANPSESLFTIDKATAATTLVYAMGNGADGEIICFNSADSAIYHWSGNGTVVFEKMNTPLTTYTPTNIPTSGTTGGETFGAMYWSPDTFLISNIASQFKFLTTSGVYGDALNSTPDDIRGIVMPPVFAASKDTVCSVNEPLTIASAATQLFKRIIYQWGDGSFDTVAAGNATHIYSAPGNFTVSAWLDNGYCAPSVYWTKAIRVNTTPVVTISGPTALCPGASITLTGSSGGASQWFVNGALIPGANANTLSVSVPGSYNMVKLNLNGCADSAAVAKNVVSVPNPTVDLGTDVTQCGGSVNLDAGSGFATYAWSSTENTQTIDVATSASVSVTVTDANSCAASDTVEVTINALPVVNLGADVSQCGGSVSLDAGNAGASYAWSGSETSQSVTITATSSVSVTVTDGNSCSASDTIEVAINDFPVVNLGADVSQCGGSVSLDAGNAGATYAWSGTETTQTVSITSSASVSVTVTDGNNCAASDTVDVTINALPVVNLGADVTQCGGSVSLDAGNAGASYAWSGSETTQSVTISSSSSVSVTVTDGNNCAASDTVEVTINALPTVSFALSTDSVCTTAGTISLSGGSPAGGIYSGPNVSNGNYTPTTAGNDTLVYAYTDGNNCSASAQAVVTVYICVGIQEIGKGTIALYPNPATDVIQFTMNDISGKITVNIIDVNGRVMTRFEEVVTTSNYQQAISVKGYAQGMYSLVVQTGGQSYSYPFIVK